MIVECVDLLCVIDYDMVYAGWDLCVNLRMKIEEKMMISWEWELSEE